MLIRWASRLSVIDTKRPFPIIYHLSPSKKQNRHNFVFSLGHGSYQCVYLVYIFKCMHHFIWMNSRQHKNHWHCIYTICWYFIGQIITCDITLESFAPISVIQFIFLKLKALLWALTKTCKIKMIWLQNICGLITKNIYWKVLHIFIYYMYVKRTSHVVNDHLGLQFLTNKNLDITFLNNLHQERSKPKYLKAK